MVEFWSFLVFQIQDYAGILTKMAENGPKRRKPLKLITFVQNVQCFRT